MSVFYRDIDVNISDYKSELSKPLIVYERDRGLEIYFNLIRYAYRFDKNPSNLLENLVGAYATVTLVNPSGYEIGINEVEITEDAKVKFVITEDLTDELTEIGIYQLQIHINNDVEGRDTSVFSIPPFNFEVRERLKGIKNELLDSEGNGLTDSEGYQLVSASTNKTINFPADKINEYLNSIPTMQSGIKDINSRLDNIENKKITTITPELFGAKGDGVTDDTEAIKLTFNKARELDKEIKFPNSKTYIVNESININYPLNVDFNNCKFICQSKMDEFYLLDINNTENVVIKNFKAKSFIDKTLYLDNRNGSTPKGLGSNVYAVYIRQCKNVVIENLDIENITGIGGFRNEKITIKNYKGYNLEMPFYFGNVKNLNIDNFNVTFNDTGVSYFYHGFYFNHVMENVKIQNGEINNPYTETVSDCFNFLTSNDKVDGEDMKDIRVNNVKCYGKFNQFTRLAECSNVKFNNIIFNSPVCTNLVEHCGTVFNQYCLIENSEFNIENINNDDRGLIKESFTSTVNFMTEFRNCKLDITTAKGKLNFVATKYNVKFINCELKITPLHTEFNIAQQSGAYICSFYSSNSTFTITDDTVKTIIAVGDFSTTSNIKLINNIFDCNCKGGFCFYNKGGIFVNNIISNGNALKQDTTDATLSNNVILSGTKS